MRKLFSILFVSAIMLSTSPRLFASCEDHIPRSLFCPDVGINLIGTGYNPATENWGWYMGAKTILLHPTKSVGIGGVGFGIVFDQSSSVNRGPVPVLTFVPLEVSGFSVELSLNRVKSRDDDDVIKYSRLILFAWNW